MKCEKCSKDIFPAYAVILDVSLSSRQYLSGNPGASRRSSVTLCPQCAAAITSNLESLSDSIQALILDRDLPEMAAMKERNELLRQERDDARAQLDMYGGDEGITAMLGRAGSVAEGTSIHARQIGEGHMEKKKRSKFIILVPVMLIIAVIAGWYYLRTWPLRFQGQLDNFFEKDNWEVISEDTKESMMYDKNITIRDAAWSSEEIPGQFHEWDISLHEPGRRYGSLDYFRPHHEDKS